MPNHLVDSSARNIRRNQLFARDPAVFHSTRRAITSRLPGHESPDVGRLGRVATTAWESIREEADDASASCNKGEVAPFRRSFARTLAHATLIAETPRRRPRRCQPYCIALHRVEPRSRGWNSSATGRQRTPLASQVDASSSSSCPRLLPRTVANII